MQAVPKLGVGVHGCIIIIDVVELERQMKQGEVPVIAGFQGLSAENRITTLGRGGTDTSAVALAAALSGLITCKDKTTAIICSGGIVDPAFFSRVLDGYF